MTTASIKLLQKSELRLNLPDTNRKSPTRELVGVAQSCHEQPPNKRSYTTKTRRIGKYFTFNIVLLNRLLK